MSIATALTVLKLLLQLSAYFARKAEQAGVEKAVLNELELLNKKYVDAAADARDDVLSGRRDSVPDDPNRRD